MTTSSDSFGRLALPGTDTVLCTAECAATLAHLIACAIDPLDPANAVRATPRLRASPGRPAQAFVAVIVGLQDLLVSADTAQLAVEILDAEAARASAAQRCAVDQLRRALSDARRLAERADAARRP